MKIILKLIAVALIFICLYFVYAIYTFSLFDKSEIKKIADIEFSDNTYKLYYIPSNATSQSYIQVRKVFNNTEHVLESFERYNFVNDYQIVNDTLRLVLSDTIFQDGKADTVFVYLK